MRTLIRHLLLIVAGVASIAIGRAQSVHWERSDSFESDNVVQLIFDDCQPDGDPQIPKIPNANLAYAGSATSMNIVNGSMSRTFALSYVVQAAGGQAIQIPAFTIKTDKGLIKVAAFDVAAPASSVTSESLASSKLIPQKTSVWAGEVFDLSYELAVARRANPQLGQIFSFDWNGAPLVTEAWPNPSVSETVLNGQRTIVWRTTTRGYVKNPNQVKLDAAHQVLNIQTGTVTFGLFVQPRMQPISVTSDQPTIDVRPLPPPPPDFSAAVGHFKLTSKIVPQEAGVGEPITWTLELSGSGNWPDIPGLPAREVSKDFQVIQPKAKRTNADGKLFDATLNEDVVLIPTKPGKYRLGPVAFTYFNPESGQYETVRTEPVTVTINAPANPNPPPASGAAGAAGSGTDSSGSIAEPGRTPTAPQLPAGIPRDPLPGSEIAPAPMTLAVLGSWLIAPICALLVFWLALAWRRAYATDPLRPRREAHRRLTQLLGELATTTANSPRDPARIKSLLGQWQHETAVVWHLPNAAPNAGALDITAPAWAKLWREADRTLYAANESLPVDWVARADAALEAKTIRPFNPLRLFLPRNLLAFAAVLAVMAASTPNRVHAAATGSPDALYRAGDFAAAEKIWQTAVNEHPTDWIARHNLALALAQQDRNGEAMAHAVAAFVQHPSDASTHWHLVMLASKSGVAPTSLQAFLKEGPAASLATLASPAEWQRRLIACAWILAGALGWLLWNAYGRRSKWQRIAAITVCAVSFLAGAGAIFGIVAYGETVDARAVIASDPATLRSIPTEADTTQKTTPLAAGTIAVVDKTFLGWDRLVFENGQTGWVRKGDVVPLWQ